MLYAYAFVDFTVHVFRSEVESSFEEESSGYDGQGISRGTTENGIVYSASERHVEIEMRFVSNFSSNQEKIEKSPPVDNGRRENLERDENICRSLQSGHLRLLLEAEASSFRSIR